MFKQPAPEEAENAEHEHGHQQEKAGKTELQQEDALMAAVFEQIQLPQVRFVQSPTLSSPPNSSVPPNSVRSEMIEQTPRTPPAILEEAETENPTEAKSSKQLQPHQIQVGYQEAAEDEEEEPSLHLLSHRNSLERHWPMAGVEGELELEEEEDATPREGSLYTPSTVLDSHRSMAATAGETPGRADEEEVADEGVEEPATEASRGSSGMSRELISSTVESALQNYSEAGGDTVFEAREENEEETEVEEEMAEEKEEQCIPVDEPKVEAEDPGPVRERSQFQLELDRRVGQRLSGSQSTSSGQSSPGSGSHPASRDIHVRTPLNDPSSPLVAKAYSAFEPEKQEMIRREIGSSGPERIRRLCGRFQAMGSGESQQPAAVDEDEVAVEEVGGGDDGAKRRMPPMLHSRQRSAHFQLAEKEPKQQEEQPKRKNTPHPFRQQSGEAGEADQQDQAGVNGRSTEIVEESQRSVADILHQFQRNSYSHANGKKAAVANGGQQQQTALSQHNLIGDTEERNGGISTKAGNGISIWANGKNSSAVGREPPPGSLAAIRKSLDSTPNTPTCPGPKILPPAPIESGLKSGQTSPGPLHGKGGVLPKNVSQFYHIWGSAQAQSAANGHGQRSIAHSPVGNGSTGDGH